nr:glycoside hydrolase family 18 protein [Bacteroides xylanisolvens]
MGAPWRRKAMVAVWPARTTFAKNIKTVLEKNKLDGIDLDFEWAENEKEI